MVSGVTCSSMAVSEKPYGWVCTKGVVGIVVDGTITQGDNIAPSTRTVDVHIRRVRSKIEDSNHTFIETVRNIGYRFRKDI